MVHGVVGISRFRGSGLWGLTGLKVSGLARRESQLGGLGRLGFRG